MKKVILSLVFSLISISAFSAEFTGQILISCTDSKETSKTRAVQSIKVTREGLSLVAWNSRAGKHVESKPFIANCTIEAERGGISAQQF